MSYSPRSQYLTPASQVPLVQPAVDAGVVGTNDQVEEDFDELPVEQEQLAPIIPVGIPAGIPISGASMSPPRQAVFTNQNSLAGSPRYPILSQFPAPGQYQVSGTIPANKIKSETIPDIRTPEPVLVNGQPFKVQVTQDQPPAPVEISVGGEPSDDEIVENELMKYGYSIVSKILIDEDNGKQCKYIKAVNRLGQVLLVDLDMYGVVISSAKDLTMVKSSSGISRNYSLKVGELDCMKLSGCNLGFICENNLCVMQNDDGDIRENNYEFVKPFTQKEVIISDSPIAIPVVHLSEIRANNLLVTKNINTLTKKLRANAYEHNCKLLKEDGDKLQDVMKCYNTYIQTMKEQKQRLMDSIKELESYLVMYDKKRSKCEWDQVEAEKVKEITANLALRTAKLNELMRSIKSVADTSRQLDIVKAEFAANIDFLKVNFKYIDMAYDM